MNAAKCFQSEHKSGHEHIKYKLNKDESIFSICFQTVFRFRGLENFTHDIIEMYDIKETEILQRLKFGLLLNFAIFFLALYINAN